jgi:hypothetical protein
MNGKRSPDQPDITPKRRRAGQDDTDASSDVCAVGNIFSTNWSIIARPSEVCGLDAVATLADGTVVIVSSSGGILNN